MSRKHSKNIQPFLQYNAALFESIIFGWVVIILETIKQFWVQNHFMQFFEVFVPSVKPCYVRIVDLIFMIALATKPFMGIAHMVKQTKPLALKQQD